MPNAQTSIPSYYEVLQVARDAPAGDIRTAYRRMAQRYHPDKSPDNKYAPKVMAHLNKAYEVLSDPARRQKHDLWIERKQAQRAQPREPSKAGGSLSRPAPLPELEQRVTRWPWYLLFATISFAVASIGAVAYRSLLPARTSPGMGNPSQSGQLSKSAGAAKAPHLSRQASR